MMKHKKLWKIIFGLLLLFSGWYIFESIKVFPQWTFRDLINVLVLFVYAYSFYIFAFQKKNKYIKFWKIFFIYYIVDLVLTFLFLVPSVAKLRFMEILYSTNVLGMESNPSSEFCLCVLILPTAIILVIAQIYVLYKLSLIRK